MSIWYDSIEQTAFRFRKYIPTLFEYFFLTYKNHDGGMNIYFYFNIKHLETTFANKLFFRTSQQYFIKEP